jgi:phosphoglycolate phosphatase
MFDLDGTILDSLPGVAYSVQQAFDACGHRVINGELRSMIGPPIRTILSRAGQVTDPAVLNKLEQAFRASYDTEGWQKTVCFSDAEAVLRALRSRGHRMFVVSNKPRHISLRILQQLGILNLFEEIVTADSRNPAFDGKPEMIEFLADAVQVPRADCLMVGDTIEDAKAAAQGGISFAFMTHGYGQDLESAAVPIAFKLDGFSQLLLLVSQEVALDR